MVLVSKSIVHRKPLFPTKHFLSNPEILTQPSQCTGYFLCNVFKLQFRTLSSNVKIWLIHVRKKYYSNVDWRTASLLNMLTSLLVIKWGCYTESFISLEVLMIKHSSLNLQQQSLSMLISIPLQSHLRKKRNKLLKHFMAKGRHQVEYTEPPSTSCYWGWVPFKDTLCSNLLLT